jgi:uncharacterized RDD family membrane protein YckC
VNRPDPLAVHGHYAGIATRFVAFLADVVIILALFAIGGRLLEYLLGLLVGHEVTFADSGQRAEVVLGVWVFAAFAVPVAVAGRTVGMGIIGLRVVRADGEPLGGGRAVVRTLVLPLSFALFGIGFLLILLRTDRRALHDLLAGSAVVYSTKVHGPEMVVGGR